MLFHRHNTLLLDVYAIGTGAAELIHVEKALRGMEGGLDYFMKADFNYPTLAEGYKVAAFDHNNKLHY